MKAQLQPIFLALLTAALVLPGLGDAPLWQDEAETALLARSIATHGVPVAFDGRNLITQNQGLEFGEDGVWTWSPWLQLYVTAASFALFGESASSARLPFALLAVVNVLLLYRYALALTGSRRTALLAGLIMVSSLAFLLHARQCRWYMPAIGATVWTLHSYLELSRGKRSAALPFAAASGLLFHSNFLVAAYVLAGVLSHFAITALAKRQPGASPRAMLLALAGFAAISGPWALYAEIWSRPNTLEEFAMPWVDRVFMILGANLTNLNHYMLPLPIALLIPWPWLALRSTRARNEIAILAAVTLSGLVLLSLMPWSYFRYLIGLLPVCSLLFAVVLDRIFESSRALGGVVCSLAIATNALSFAIGPRELRSDLASYLEAVVDEPIGPNRGIIDYLSDHGRPDELVLTSYGRLPIVFHTGMRAVGFGQDLRVEEKPDWIIPRKQRPGTRYLLKRARGYERTLLAAPDLRWGNRPDPNWFRARVRGAPSPVVLYRKRDPQRDDRAEP